VRPLRRGTNLARLCSFRYEATVLKDNTVRIAGHIVDIPPGPGRSYADHHVRSPPNCSMGSLRVTNTIR